MTLRSNYVASNADIRNMAVDVAADIASALGVVGVTASAAEINVLDGSTATNQDLKDIHTNIAEINKLIGASGAIDGIVASSNRTAILQEIADRLIALENA